MTSILGYFLVSSWLSNYLPLFIFLFTANCPKVAAKPFIFLVPTRCLRHYVLFPIANCPTVHSPKTSIFWPSHRDIHISRPVRRDKNKSQLDIDGRRKDVVPMSHFVCTSLIPFYPTMSFLFLETRSLFLSNLLL